VRNAELLKEKAVLELFVKILNTNKNKGDFLNMVLGGQEPSRTVNDFITIRKIFSAKQYNC